MSQQAEQHPAGFVGNDKRGHFVHYCHCGEWGAFGHSTMRKGDLGKWYCSWHNPDRDRLRAMTKVEPIIVTLSDVWRAKAVEVGKQRQAYAETNSLKRYGYGTDNPEIYHINGALAEAAVAKYFRLPWRPDTTKVGGIDVDGKIEVRGRPVPGPGTDHNFRPHDKEHLPYVLVHVHTGDNTMHLIGWLYGHEGMNKPEHWNEGCRSWFIPPPYRTISDLVSRLAAARRIA